MVGGLTKTMNDNHQQLRTNTPTVNLNTILCTDGFTNSLPITFLLDLGAAVSVVRFGSLSSEDHRAMIRTELLTVSANGTSLHVQGQIQLLVSLGPFTYKHAFVVIHDLTVDCLLGANFLKKHGAVIDCKSGTLSLGLHAVPIHTILQDVNIPQSW